MAERKILSVGFEIPGYAQSYLPFDSDRSLLDADLVVFSPTFSDFNASTYYQGKPRIDDDDGVRAVEHCRRWRQELIEFLQAGKTAIVFLQKPIEVFVHLGKKTFSGIGRNQKVTYIVEPLSSYSSLPFDLGTIIPKGGSEIRTIGDFKPLVPYWNSFGAYSPYSLYMKQPNGRPILTTTNPDAIVGLLFTVGKGSAILVPPIKYDQASFTRKTKKGEEVWSDEAVKFGHRLISALVELDRAVRADEETTPAPGWAISPEYSIPAQQALEKQAGEVEAQIQVLRNKRDSLVEKAGQAASLRDLLYETGKPLERAVLRALKAMGFSAKPLKESGSEFDAVFSAQEGRFIGEVEGKNDKAVSIEKMDQLERNIREDFARENSAAYAKGVLFGNAYRLQRPFDRPDFFTAKCRAAAQRGKVALVRTPDLFQIVRYLEAVPDEAFAMKCRSAILSAEGNVVTFPPVPVPEQPTPA